MSGRGRGLSNLPAWMTRDGGPPPGPPRGGPPPGPGYGSGPPPGGYPVGPPRGYDDRRPPDYFDSRGREFGNRRGSGDGHRGHSRDRDRGGGFRDRRDSRDRGGPPRRSRSSDRGRGPMFRSLEEEQAWLEERRRKRLSRPTKFDKEPTQEQLAADAAAAAFSNPAATDFAGIPADRNFSAIPQQTRHARRLYIGQLPPNVTEDEVHNFFRSAIEQAIVGQTLHEDPVLSVYINYERRFSFLEFKTVEMTTACMALDGININGKGKVKIKRPNDYNPAMAPKVGALPDLDISRLGIISGTVQDGPNKVFVGGLHYHLTDEQVLELLQAFGKVKAFHLVKNDPDAMTSKGYCFVEYADPAVTQVAVLGLNGMDLGGGKMLTARVAGERTAAMAATSPMAAAAVYSAITGALPADGRNIVCGYDVEELVDAAMGLKPMPTAPTHMDNLGLPVTRIAPVAIMAAAAQHQSPQRAQLPQVPQAAVPTQPSALDIANAVQAAYGAGVVTAPANDSNGPTRILVLSNMVMAEDLASDDDYQGLTDEVKEECEKFGTLKGMNIPRRVGGGVEASAIQKIFLEYATVQDAQAAERELSGRKFGPNVVQTSYFSEAEYAAGRFK